MAPAAGAEPPAEGWLELPGAMPVAAALVQAGRWHLDGPPQDFDATGWWFRCRFDRPAASPAWCLGLEGLAGLAEVLLNGRPVGRSTNMFRSHEWPVDDLLPRGNELLIRFDPLAAALAQRRPRPRWRVPMLLQQQLRWFRTTLLGRTPGWSVPAAVVGPWRPAWLEPLDGVRLEHLQWQAQVAGSTGRLQVQLGLSGLAEGASLRLRVERAERAEGTPATVHQAVLAPAGEPGRWQAQVDVPAVARWWPHTHGEPALYQVTLWIQAGPGAPWRWPLGRVGFRSLKVEQGGGGFRILVNDVPVFARGACWTPLDPLRLHAAPVAYDTALGQVRAAGLNLLRLPGAMVYEDDAFLDACDRHGVMLWQDLMFASMDYPADDPAFAAEVEEEVAQQLSRLQGRPCLAVVCGNSEVSQQAAMWGAERSLWQPPLFHDHLPAQVERLLPGTPYWPSSAWGGAFPFQASAGTTSYYGLGAYRRALDDARHSGLRFATECLGFAQVPGDTTLARLRADQGGEPLRVHSPLWKARASRDLGAGWDFDDVRDHYVGQLYAEPAEALRQHDPARHLMLGRAAVAEVVEAAFHQWRAADSSCSGALVWFLRDFRAGAGWGFLDDLGLPKSGFHALARACRPLHLGVVDEGLNGFVLHLVNETAQPLALRLEVTLHGRGGAPVAQGGQPVMLAPRSAQAVPLAACLPGFCDATWAYRFGPAPAELLVARCLDDQGAVRAELLRFIDPPGSRLARRDLGLQAWAEPLPDGAKRVTVRSREAARAVHLEAEGWQADDEFFHLPPGGQRSFDCRPVPGHARPWRALVWAINALQPAVIQAAAVTEPA